MPDRRALPYDHSVKPAKATPYDVASWTLAVLGMLFVIKANLLPALIAGLMVYELVHVLFPVFARRLPTKRAKATAVAIIALVVLGALGAAGFAIVVFTRSEGGSVAALLAKMAEILETSRATLPQWLSAYLPAGVEDVRDDVSDWLREHATELRSMGRDTAVTLAHVLVGMVIGAMVSMREAFGSVHRGPLARAVAERLYRMGEAFRRVVFAQVRISAINTLFTAIYLTVVLPLFGVHLPLTKTMIAVTFIAGLLPVLGNLISNTMIVVVSLANSPAVAIASLAFLIVIHKLEYFLNARIVGRQISARAWELLTAMVVLEAVFGLAGLIAAPICYAWLKDELVSRELI